MGFPQQTGGVSGSRRAAGRLITFAAPLASTSDESVAFAHMLTSLVVPTLDSQVESSVGSSKATLGKTPSVAMRLPRRDDSLSRQYLKVVRNIHDKAPIRDFSVEMNGMFPGGQRIQQDPVAIRHGLLVEPFVAWRRAATGGKDVGR